MRPILPAQQLYGVAMCSACGGSGWLAPPTAVERGVFNVTQSAVYGNIPAPRPASPPSIRCPYCTDGVILRAVSIDALFEEFMYRLVTKLHGGEAELRTALREAIVRVAEEDFRNA